MLKKVENKEKALKKNDPKKSLAEYEKKVIDLANKNLTAEKIGEQLRRRGIHPKEYGVKISKILQDKNLYVNPDLKNVEEKLKRISEHSEKNKQDKRAKRERVRVYAELRKLKKYFNVKSTAKV